ncbi:MAG: MMPL family transporter [Candidatus Izemoplasma sp.]
MLQKIAEMIMKRPMKIIFIGIVVFLVLLAGATQVTLETGNDTLIQTDTDEYIDNFEYQAEFGSDPIIVIYKGDGYDELFTVENLAFMAELESELSYYDEVFTINSPVSLVKEFAEQSAAQFEQGLGEIAVGLSDLSNTLAFLSASLADASTADVSTAITILNNSVATIDGVIVDLEADPLLGDQVTSLNAVNDQLEALVVNLTSLSEDQVEMAAEMATLSMTLGMISTNLGETAAGVQNIYDNFNLLYPGLPTEQATLDMMVYDEFGEIRSMFTSFTIDDQYMMFLVVLEGEVDDAIVGDIIDSIINSLEAQGLTETTLVSGKPVLDRSIKEEMMGSMQVMMALSAVIMIVVLLIVFKVRWSLLPLAIIMFAVLATIGIMGWLSIGLTMVSMAVFPVLIGLGIDYSIQFQSRYAEELAGGLDNE